MSQSYSICMRGNVARLHRVWYYYKLPARSETLLGKFRWRRVTHIEVFSLPKPFDLGLLQTSTRTQTQRGGWLAGVKLLTWKVKTTKHKATYYVYKAYVFLIMIDGKCGQNSHMITESTILCIELLYNYYITCICKVWICRNLLKLPQTVLNLYHGHQAVCSPKP